MLNMMIRNGELAGRGEDLVAPGKTCTTLRDRGFDGIRISCVSSGRGRYDLETLLSQMPEEYQPEALYWGPPAGKEAW